MKIIQKGCAAAFAVMIGAGAVQAQTIAHLTTITGTVLIGWNGEYQPVAPGSAPALSKGTSVITLEDSGAEVVYEDACRVVMPENSLVLLDTADECSRGLVLVQSAPSSASLGLDTGTAPAAAGGPSALGTLGAMATFAGFAVLVNETGDDAPVPPPPLLSPE